MIRILYKCIRRLYAAEQGIAYVEFALGIPLLLVLFMGGVEVSRYILINQKMEKTVSTVADVLTQTNPSATPMSAAQINQLMSAIDDMMSPYSVGATSKVIVSNITKTGAANPVVNWQYCTNGGTLPAVSKLGLRGQAAVLPNGFTMIAGEEVMISEFFYRYSPIMANNFVGTSTIYKYAVYMPRLGALTGLNSTCP